MRALTRLSAPAVPRTSGSAPATLASVAALARTLTRRPSRLAAGPDDPGVRSLLDRDRAMAGLAADDLVEDAFLEETEKAERERAAAAANAPQAAPVAAVTPSPSSSSSAPAAPVSTPATSAAKAAASRARGGKVKAVEEAEAADDGITTCRAALDAGEAALRSGDAPSALALFERALDLPGSAAVRPAGRPLEFAVPSDGEAAAALYNMACAYAALGQVDAGLTCLEAAVESPGAVAGDIAAGMGGGGDPDLAPLRASPGFARLAARAAAVAASGASGGDGDNTSGGAPGGGPLGGLLGGVFGKKGGGKGGKGGGGGGVMDRMLRPW